MELDISKEKTSEERSMRQELDDENLRIASLLTEDQIRLKTAIVDEDRIDLFVTEVLGFDLEPFHLEILKLTVKLYRESGEGLLLAPRGFGKSTIGTVAFALWLVCVKPNIRILINSSSAGKAQNFMRQIKLHLEQNPNLIAMFGEQYNDKHWNNNEIVVKTRTEILKEPTISAHGWSGAVVGNHYDVHLIDDLVNEDNARTKGQREKLKDWYYMSLDPTLEPHGFRLNTGTRYHYDDLYGHFIEQAKAEKMEQEHAMMEEASDEEDVRPLRVLRLKAIQDDNTSLWENKFPIRKLLRKKSRMGSIRFNAQFQNETDLMKGKVFKEEYFRFYKRDEIHVPDLEIYQGVDLAIGQKQENDYFALVTKGYDPMTNFAYTLDVVHGRYTFRDQMILILWKAGKDLDEIKSILGIPDLPVKHIIKLFKGQPKHAKRQYDTVKKIGIESVAYQKVLPEELIMRTRDLPIFQIQQKLDKKSRLEKYSARWENGMEFLPEDNSCVNLVEELLLFDDGEHDDLPDAHEICNRVASLNFEFEDEDEDDEVTARVFG